MDKRVIIGVAIVLAAAGGVYWWKEDENARKTREAAAVLLAAADQARADMVRSESAAARAVSTAERTARNEQRIAQALDRLRSDRAMTRCEAALELGRLGAREHAAALKDVMQLDGAPSVRVCAAGALVTVGEHQTAMQAYTEWAGGTDASLRRSALIGFGEIGPSTAAVAIPHLADELRSPHMDARFIAVDTLSKLGPAAVPLLEQASKDTDRQVREYAERLLKMRSSSR
jgi:hypothetical protein